MSLEVRKGPSEETEHLYGQKILNTYEKINNLGTIVSIVHCPATYKISHICVRVHLHTHIVRFVYIFALLTLFLKGFQSFLP